MITFQGLSAYLTRVALLAVKNHNDMNQYIVELPVKQTNEEADSAWASDTINGTDFISKSQLEEKLNSLHIDKYYLFTVDGLISHVNNGNDNFSESYLAYINL